MAEELTPSQIDRQDCVESSIEEMLRELSGKEIEHDMELIDIVREAVQEVIVDRLHLMTEMEFYPYMQEDEVITVDVSDVNWELLRKQKLHLLEILSDKNSSITAEHCASIEGIVNLLDAMQDNVVATGKLSEDEVFGELAAQEETDASNAHELGF